MFRVWRNMAVPAIYGLLCSSQLHVIETGDAPTVSHVERRDGRLGAVTLVREAGPHGLVHSMERLWAIHEREGRNIGQVLLDQLRVRGLQLGRVGFSGDRVDQLVDLGIRVLAP